MAQNYISRGEVITLTATENHASGSPYRINGFNGVSLLTVIPGETLSFQLEGIFEFELADVKEGHLIYIDDKDNLTNRVLLDDMGKEIGVSLFGRAVTRTDSSGKFYLRLLQSE